jgi:hypothetical protein
VNTTPLWVPLVIAVLGVLGSVCGTIAGVVITQRRSDRREEERWARERERERASWAREDARRTFEERRDCYVEFEEHLRSTALSVYNAGYELGPQLEFNWQFPLYQRLLRLRVFATEEARAAADDAYNAVWRWGHAEASVGEDAFHEGEHSYDTAAAEYLSVIRRDLGVEDCSG